MRIPIVKLLLFMVVGSVFIQSLAVFVKRSAPALAYNQEEYVELTGMKEWLYGPYLCVDNRYLKDYSIYNEADWQRCKNQEKTFFRYDYRKNISTKLTLFAGALGFIFPIALIMCCVILISRKLRNKVYYPYRSSFVPLLVISVMATIYNGIILMRLMASMAV